MILKLSTRASDELVRVALIDRGVSDAELLRVASSTVMGTSVCTRTKIVHLSPGYVPCGEDSVESSQSTAARARRSAWSV